MALTSKFFITLGCFSILAAFILKIIWFSSPGVIAFVKPSSFLILGNISFVLALLVKK